MVLKVNFCNYFSTLIEYVVDIRTWYPVVGSECQLPSAVPHNSEVVERGTHVTLRQCDLLDESKKRNLVRQTLDTAIIQNYYSLAREGSISTSEKRSLHSTKFERYKSSRLEVPRRISLLFTPQQRRYPSFYTFQ